MIPPEALRIAGLGDDDRIKAISDLVQAAEDYHRLLSQLVVKLDIYAGTATAEKPALLLSRVRVMRTFLLSIGVPKEDIADPETWLAKLQEAESLRAALARCTQERNEARAKAALWADVIDANDDAQSAVIESITRIAEELARSESAECRRQGDRLVNVVNGFRPFSGPPSHLARVMEAVRAEADFHDQYGHNHLRQDGREAWTEMADRVAELASFTLANPPAPWASILMGAVADALRATSPADLRGDLIHLVMVVVAWLEALERREVPRADPS